MRSLRLILVFCIVLAVISPGVESRRRRSGRTKRRIDEFAQMIVRTCDRNPLDFNGYGNWCGFGGSGDTVDEIDKCCMVHDKCYAHLNRHECQAFVIKKVYTKQYHWSFQNDAIICEDTDTCGNAICECDRAAAMCFKKNNHLYNRTNKRSGILLSSISKVLSIDWSDNK